MSSRSETDLANDHMPLVEKIVARERRRLGNSVETEDLRSFALEGLAQAINRYDPNAAASFATFAGLRIRGAIYDGLSQAGWLPRRLHRQIKFYKRSAEMIEAKSEEPLPATGVEAAHKLADTLKELATAYITTYASENESVETSHPAEAEYAIDQKRYLSLISEKIEELPPKQLLIVRGFFFEERTLTDLGAELGVTKSWASKLLSSALARLRTEFDEEPDPLDSYQPPVG